jgi:hypothetical protein
MSEHDQGEELEELEGEDERHPMATVMLNVIQAAARSMTAAELGECVKALERGERWNDEEATTFLNLFRAELKRPRPR